MPPGRIAGTFCLYLIASNHDTIVRNVERRHAQGLCRQRLQLVWSTLPPKEGASIVGSQPLVITTYGVLAV